MVKIRLQRKGRRKKPFYHIVVADARAPRDGRFIEKIGTYNPMTVPATIDLDRDRAYEWLMNGAQPTDTARAILRFKGVMYRKHLMRGVKKGALTQEDADTRYQEWIAAKEAKVAARFEKTAEEKVAYLAKLSGTPPPKKAKVEEAAATTEHAPADQSNKSFAESVEQTTVESVTEAQGIAADVPVETPAPEPVVEEAPTPEPVAEAPAPEPEPVAPVEEPTPEPVVETPAEEVKPDDLKKIEGVGPKIAELLINGGIPTFVALADAPVERLKEILAAAGSRYTMHDPTTWPQQARLAADGKWEELDKLQDELDGGKVVKAAAPAAEEE